MIPSKCLSMIRRTKQMRITDSGTDVHDFDHLIGHCRLICQLVGMRQFSLMRSSVKKS